MDASRFSLPARAAHTFFLTLALAAAAFFPGAGANSISAAPSSLPAVPGFSTPIPVSAPDVMPVLPTPSGGAGRATRSGSMPVIPSNPSPPDPDHFGPTSALTPVGSSAAAVAPSAARSRRTEACHGAATTLALLLLLRF